MDSERICGEAASMPAVPAVVTLPKQYVRENSQPNISRHLAYLKNSGMVIDRREGYRVFYCIATPRESGRKLLFEFLRQVFKNEEQLDQDTRRLKEAIATGSCTISEWKPYSAIGKDKPQRPGA